MLLSVYRYHDRRRSACGFAAVIASRGLTGAPPLESELALARACAAGDPHAIARLEATVLRPVGEALARMASGDGLAEEALQILRHKLLAEVPPKIGSYRGTGSLVGWVRVAAARELVTLRRRAHGARHAALDDAHELASPAADPELAHMRRLYADHFRRAFAAALTELTPRERNVLRHQLVDRLQLEEIGTLYGVHHITVARWLARARRGLLAGTQTRLRAALGLDEAELASVLRLLPSQLDVSVHRLLAEGADDAG